MCIVYAPGTFEHDERDQGGRRSTRRVMRSRRSAPRWKRARRARCALDASTTRRGEQERVARRQVGGGHGGRLRGGSGLRAAVRRGGRAGSSSPTSTSIAPRRRCASIEDGRRHRDRRPVRRVEGGRRRGDDRARGLDLRSARHPLQQRRRPDAPAGPDLRGAHRRGLRPAVRGQRRGRVPRAASTRSCSSRQQGGGGVILNTGSVAGLVSWGGTRLRLHQGCGAPAHPGRRHRGRAVRHPLQRDLPGGHAVHQLHGRHGGMDGVRARTAEQMAPGVGAMHPLGRPIPPRTAPRPRCTWCRTRRRTSPACCCRSTAGTSHDDRDGRRPGCSIARSCGDFSTCAAASTRRSAGRTPTIRTRSGTQLREQAPVHAGIVHELTGYPATGCSRACRTPTGRTSPRSATRRATPRFRDPRGVRLVPGAEEPDDDDRAGRDEQHAVDGRRPAPALPRARAAVVRARQGPVVDRQLDRADGRTR